MRPSPRAIVALVVATATLVPACPALAAPIWSTAPAPSSTAPAQQRTIAEGGGAASIVWQQSTASGTELWSARRTGPSGDVSRPARISAAATAGQGITADEPTVAAADGGKLIAAWTARLPSSTRTVIVVSVRVAAGADWSSPVTISDTTYPSSSPSVAIDSAGQAVIAWQQGSADYTVAKVAGLDLSTYALTNPQTFSSNAGHVAQPRVAASAQGSAFVSYVETAVSFSPPYTGAVTMRAATRNPGAATFGSVTQVVKLNSAVVTDVQLVADEAGTATIAWAQLDSSTGAPGGAWAATRMVGSTTWPGLRLSSTSGSSPALATSQQGGAALAWVEPASGRNPADEVGTVNLARRAPSSTNWKANPTVALTPAEEQASSPAAGMTPNGTIAVAWTAHTGAGDQARQSVWTVGNAAPWPSEDLGDAGGTLSGAAVVVDDTAGLATWLRSRADSSAQFLASLDSSTVFGTPPAPANPAPTATPAPTGAPAPVATPTPAPSNPAPGVTVRPSATPTPAVKGVVGITSPASTAISIPAASGAVAGPATFSALKALGKKRFKHGACARSLVAAGAGLPLELRTTQAGTMRFVITSKPKGKRARNLKPSLTLAVSPGATRTVFTGCLAGKPLRRGTYALKVVYTDATGTVRGRRALPFVISR